MISFGTYLLQKEFLSIAVRQAHQECQIFHFDTAQLYKNEEQLASTLAAIRQEYEIKNGKSPAFHITTKIGRHGANKETIEASLARLKSFKKTAQDTVTILLHWPMPQKIWDCLQEACTSRLIDRIGVCNHTKEDLEKLFTYAKIMPYCNQIELHPFVPHKQLMETIEFCKKHNIVVEAHTVLAKAKFFQHGLLVLLAQKYSRSVAQIMIQWAMQIGAQKLCLSSKNIAHVCEWNCVYESDNQYFTLSQEDMQQIETLSTNEPTQFYGARVGAKVIKAFSLSSQEAIDFLLLESFLAPPIYEKNELISDGVACKSDSDGVARKSDSDGVGVIYKNEKARRDVLAIVTTLKQDLAFLATGCIEKMSMCAQNFPSVLVAPNTTLAVGQQLLAAKYNQKVCEKKYQNDKSAVDRSIVALMREILRVLRSTLLRREKEKEMQKRAKQKNIFCTLRKNLKINDDSDEETDWVDMGLDRPFSDAILSPEPMPVTVPEASEFTPFFSQIRGAPSFSKEGPTCAMRKKNASSTTFVRGTLFEDGRIDVCKQVVGSDHIKALCDAVRENRHSAGATFTKGTLFNDGRVDVCKQVVGTAHIGDLCDAVRENHEKNDSHVRARHFLLGNNIACRTVDGKDDCIEAAQHMAQLMADWRQVPIETWYLAGNGIGPNSIALFAKALEKNEIANALWLKRNPIGSDLGPRSIGSMLSLNKHLRVLDLHNCGLFDAGVKAFADAATANNQQCNLQFLYLDANGITAQGAIYLEKFLQLNRDVLQGFYISMNRLGSKGALSICNNLRNSKSLSSLCLDSNSIENSGLVEILEQCAFTWPKIQSFSVGYYKATWDMGEQPNFIGKDLPPTQNGKSQPQLVSEDRVVSLMRKFIEQTPQLAFCSLKGNRFSKHAQELLAKSAWLRAPNFHFEVKALFARSGDTPATPSMEKLKTQAVKHGPLVVNIDSIYRNNM